VLKIQNARYRKGDKETGFQIKEGWQRNECFVCHCTGNGIVQGSQKKRVLCDVIVQGMALYRAVKRSECFVMSLYREWHCAGQAKEASAF